MQRIVILCPKQEVDRDDPSDLIIYRGSVRFYQKENRDNSITVCKWASYGEKRRHCVVCQSWWEALEPLVPVQHKPGSLCAFLTVKVISCWERTKGRGGSAHFWHVGIKNGWGFGEEMFQCWGSCSHAVKFLRREIDQSPKFIRKCLL